MYLNLMIIVGVNLYFNSFAHITCGSRYYLENTFKEQVNYNNNISTDSFSVFHHNIRSVPTNLCKLIIHLENLDFKFSVIGLSETWFKDHNVLVYNMDGYNHVYNYRLHRSGGGVSLFIKEDLQYTKLQNLCLMNDCIERVFIEIAKSSTKSTKNIIVGNVYKGHFHNIGPSLVQKLSNH